MGSSARICEFEQRKKHAISALARNISYIFNNKVKNGGKFEFICGNCRIFVYNNPNGSVAQGIEQLPQERIR